MSEVRDESSPRGSRRAPEMRLGETSIIEWMPSARALDVLREGYVHLHIVAGGNLTQGSVADARDQLSVGSAFFTRGAGLTLRTSEDCRLITVSVPSDLFPGSNGYELEGVQVVRRDSGLLPPVRAFIAQARGIDAAELSGVGRYYLERLLQEMVLALAVKVDRLAGVPRTPDAFARALMIIAAQCADPELSAASIARHLNLSLRQLERVFHDRATTIGVEVRRARVEHALALLRNPDYDALSVDQIATYSGFSNGSSLARAMRAAGHPSPSSVR